ncbi:UNVERIFIED_CONTAM: hypothetical protein HDU68_012248 [Siphonaria sp. JEL0065]|nr:hypothetical protein HDU68_012248 [Siphonaria sp. JEL0065]
MREPVQKTWIERVIPQQTEDITVKWALHSLKAISVVTLLCVGCEVWIMVNESTVRNLLNANLKSATADDKTALGIEANFRVGLTYHSVFLASLIYWFVVTWDALMHANIMQCISVNFYNAGLFIYAILQINQTAKDLEFINTSDLSDPSLASYNTGYFLASQLLIPIIIGLFTPVFAYLTYRMHLEFGWRQYRISGGSIKLEKVFFAYHILLLLLKYALFFVTGFTVLDLALTYVSEQGKYVIPIGAAVVGALTSACGFYGARYEKKSLILLYITGCVAVIGYLVDRVYDAVKRSKDPTLESDFERAKSPFLMYAATSGVLVIASLVFGVVSYNNFNKGLRQVLDGEEKRKKGEVEAVEIDLDA